MVADIAFPGREADALHGLVEKASECNNPSHTHESGTKDIDMDAFFAKLPDYYTTCYRIPIKNSDNTATTIIGSPRVNVCIKSDTVEKESLMATAVLIDKTEDGSDFGAYRNQHGENESVISGPTGDTFDLGFDTVIGLRDFVRTDGKYKCVTFGWIDLDDPVSEAEVENMYAYRVGADRVADVYYDYCIDMLPTAYTVAPGHYLELVILPWDPFKLFYEGSDTNVKSQYKDSDYKNVEEYSFTLDTDDTVIKLPLADYCKDYQYEKRQYNNYGVNMVVNPDFDELGATQYRLEVYDYNDDKPVNITGWDEYDAIVRCDNVPLMLEEEKDYQLSIGDGSMYLALNKSFYDKLQDEALQGATLAVYVRNKETYDYGFSYMCMNNKVESISLDLSDAGAIGLKLYFDLGREVTDGGKLVFEDADTGSISEVTDFVPDRDGMYQYTYGVGASRMNDTIKISAYDKNGALVKLANLDSVDGVYHCSVMTYVDAVINSGNYSSELVRLANSIKTYGLCAQYYFDYKKPDILPTVAVPSYEGVNDTVVTGELPTGLSYIGSSLVLDNTVKYRHYFKAADDLLQDQIGALSATFKKSDGLGVGGDAGAGAGAGAGGSGAFTKLVSAGDNLYYVESSGIPAPRLGDVMTMDILGTSNDVIASIQYSPIIYCSKANATGNKPLTLLANSMYEYYMAAAAYFN